jgi:hypothetical protein
VWKLSQMSARNLEMDENADFFGGVELNSIKQSE